MAWIGQYILNDRGEPERCDDFLDWAAWLEAHHVERLVAKDRDEGPDAPAIEVSTVFIGLDPSDNDPPLLWETMIFGGPLDLRRWKYGSLAEARLGHQAACQLVQETLAVRQES